MQSLLLCVIISSSYRFGFGGGGRGGFGGGPRGGFGGPPPHRPHGYYGWFGPRYRRPYYGGGGCLGGMMAMLVLPIIIILVAVILIMSLFGSALGTLVSGGEVKKHPKEDGDDGTYNRNDSSDDYSRF